MLKFHEPTASELRHRNSFGKEKDEDECIENESEDEVDEPKSCCSKFCNSQTGRIWLKRGTFAGLLTGFCTVVYMYYGGIQTKIKCLWDDNNCQSKNDNINQAATKRLLTKFPINSHVSLQKVASMNAPVPLMEKVDDFLDDFIMSIKEIMREKKTVRLYCKIKNAFNDIHVEQVHVFAVSSYIGGSLEIEAINKDRGN